MKILFVEDELSRNIPKIIRLFKKFLGDDNVLKLKKLEEDESGYGAEPEEIKKILNSTGIIETEYYFPSALKNIYENFEDYSIFIIDRNLSEKPYQWEELKKIDERFEQNFYEKFFEREGDYFLEFLITQNVNVSEKFFFLTANTTDSLKNINEIQSHIDFGRFKAKNFIDKAESKELEKLKQRIENNEIINLRKENMLYLQILENRIAKTFSERFFHLLKNKDLKNVDEIFENLGTIRNIFENILTEFAKVKSAPEICFGKKNKSQIIMRNVIRWINDFDKEKKKPIYRFNSNSLMKNFFYDIQEICSDFGPHAKSVSKGFQPTSNTVNALIYELKDIILWFDKSIEELSP